MFDVRDSKLGTSEFKEKWKNNTTPLMDYETHFVRMMNYKRKIKKN